MTIEELICETRGNRTERPPPRTLESIEELLKSHGAWITGSTMAETPAQRSRVLAAVLADLQGQRAR